MADKARYCTSITLEGRCDKKLEVSVNGEKTVITCPNKKDHLKCASHKMPVYLTNKGMITCAKCKAANKK